MIRYCIAHMDESVRQGIVAARYTEMELEGIRCQLRRQVEERTKATAGVHGDPVSRARE